MKKAFYYAAFAMIITGSVFTSCQSKVKKVENAKENVQDAKQELKKAQRELSSEYPEYRTKAESKIDENKLLIAELREKLNKLGKAPLDEMRKKRIDELEKRNNDLRNKLYGYENERSSDWEAFKSEINTDVESIGTALKNLGPEKNK
jgi:hypothetical protein